MASPDIAARHGYLLHTCLHPDYLQYIQPEIVFRNPRNVQEKSAECSREIRGMFERNPRNVQEKSAECSREICGTFEKKIWNVPQKILERSKKKIRTFEKKFWNVRIFSPERAIFFWGTCRNIPENVHSRFLRHIP